MALKIVLSIKSSGRDNKQIKLAIGKKEILKDFSGDMLSNIKMFLQSEGLSFNQINKIIPIESQSFTGYRETLVIANTFNGIFKGTPLSKLCSGKYHKSPNIN